MVSRYLLGDFREGRVACPGIFEAVLRHRDGVCAAMPFAHLSLPKTISARSDGEVRLAQH
jgi:hypothetical protein